MPDVQVTEIELLTPKAASEYMRAKYDGGAAGQSWPSIDTFARWRTAGGGPVYVKLGRRVFYTRAELDRFIARGRRTHTHDDEARKTTAA